MLNIPMMIWSGRLLGMDTQKGFPMPKYYYTDLLKAAWMAREVE